MFQMYRRNSDLSLFCFKLLLLSISILCWFQLVDGLSLSSDEWNDTDENDYYSSEDSNTAVCVKDEYNKTCCEQNEFQCGNGACIPLEKVCNSNSSSHRIIYHWYYSYKGDCKDYSDEIGCSDVSCASRESLTCPQTCIDLPNNKSQCTCYKGYKLIRRFNNLTCEDVDECAIGVHSCSHDCINHNGTFSCSCKDGYHLNTEDSTGDCNVKDGDTLILFSKDHRIYSLNRSTNAVRLVVHSGIVEKIDYDPATDILYWSNSTTISRSYIPGAKNGTVTIGHVQAVGVPEFRDNIMRDSLAIDWTAGNLYWLSRDSINDSASQVMVSKLDGRYIKTIIEIPKASSLVLDPEFGRMYWACGGDDPHIGSAWMNGMLRSTIVRLPNQYPIALTLDHLSNGRLYWVDSLNNTIYYVFKDGTRPTAVYTTTPARAPSSLDVFENNLYWVTETSNELLTINKFGKGEVKVVYKYLQDESKFKVYHKLKIETNIRSGGLYCRTQCSHLCLHIPRGYSCTCADGNRLVTIGGEIVCDNEREKPEDDPLDCNCDDKKVCNTSSPYRHCSCDAHCSDGLGDIDYEVDLYTMVHDNKLILSPLSLILISITVVVLIVAIILSFYKKDNAS